MPEAASGTTDMTRDEIEEMIKSRPVVLFMKGSPAMPQCGFSASVVEILDRHLSQYRSVDVLADENLRATIKEFSDWPTIPQLYVGGSFLGGADIVRQMDESGELKDCLGEAIQQSRESNAAVAGHSSAAPHIVMTDRAVEAALASKTEEDGPHLRIEITSDFQHGLNFSHQKVDDFVVPQAGISLILNLESAVRAQDLEIDFVEEKGSSGFKIKNPNSGRKPENNKGANADEVYPQLPPPSVKILDAAYDQFISALQKEGEGTFGVRIRANRMGEEKCTYELDIVPAADRRETDFEVLQRDLTMWFGPRDAKNLDGVVIDYLESENGAGFKFENPKLKDGWKDDRAHTLQALLDTEINPSIAAHGGYIELLDLFGNTAYVLMGGGCQGCGMAEATLEQGIQDRVRETIPSIERIVDITDHGAGENPYYQAR